jgi:hypothetical protein
LRFYKIKIPVKNLGRQLCAGGFNSGVEGLIFIARNLNPAVPSWYRAAAIQQRVTAVLLSISKEAIADSFQKLYERCQQCVVKDGDYFEVQ